MSYAQGTNVSIDRSQAEIKKTLQKYGANGFAFAETTKGAVVMFEMSGRRVKFTMPYPDRNAKDIVIMQKGGYSSAPKEVQNSRYEQKCRARWRALSLAIKAKLECVASGIATLEEEFLNHILLPSGETVGAVMIPQIDKAYKTGKMPPLLGYGG